MSKGVDWTAIRADADAIERRAEMKKPLSQRFKHVRKIRPDHEDVKQSVKRISLGDGNSVTKNITHT